MIDEEVKITVTLSLAQWRTVAGLVEAGTYRDVQTILSALYGQVNAVINAANQQTLAALAAEALAKQTETTQEPITDESSETQSRQERAPLH